MNVPIRLLESARLARPGLRSIAWAPLLLCLLLGSCGDDECGINLQENPVPVLQSLSPDVAVFGDSSFTLALAGSGFVSGSVMKWNGMERATTFVSATLLHAVVLESDLRPGYPIPGAAVPADGEGGSSIGTPAPAAPAEATVQVWVTNPPLGGGTSDALPFRIVSARPAPWINEIVPPAAAVGDPETVIAVNGACFFDDSVVRWDGDDLSTVYVDPHHLDAVVPAARLALGGNHEITVFTPWPGGGLSPSRVFDVGEPNPHPVITSISPDHMLVDQTGIGITLEVTGAGFLESSRIFLDDQPRSTTYVDAGLLRTYIYGGEFDVAATHQVTVRTPPPGGGASEPAILSVENPVPVITMVTPGVLLAGGPDVTLILSGSGFVQTSVVLWNGEPRPTEYNYSGSIRVTIPAEDIVEVGSARIIVRNPAPGGGDSAEREISIYRSVLIRTNDLVFDPPTNRIYASVASNEGAIGNTISAIDPETGTVISSVFVGSDPTTLARSDNGQYLYVALHGAAKVRRYVIATATADIEFPLGESWAGPLYAEDIAVVPGSPESVVISTMREGLSPRHGGVFVYDDGVRRASGTQEHTGSNRIEASADPAVYYGYNNETTEFGFRRLTVDESGIHEEQVVGDLISGFGADILFAGGRVYATNGQVVDPQAMSLAGQMAGQGHLAIDTAHHRAFFLGDQEISVFDTETFTPLGSIPVQADVWNSGPLLLLGGDALAYRKDAETVVFLKHHLVGGK
jgi:DNA-binding beta-propeller fold protein YncE